jgi:hypothetical protein
MGVTEEKYELLCSMQYKLQRGVPAGPFLFGEVLHTSFVLDKIKYFSFDYNI